MASVAGAIAEFSGNELLAYSGQIIIENGGDIFIKSDKIRTIAIYAGDSPVGICTSSGTVGHSIM